MNRDDVIEAVYEACTEVLGADRSALSEATAFAADLDANSLALVEIVMQLEEKIGKEVELDQKVETVQELVDFIAAKYND